MGRRGPLPKPRVERKLNGNAAKRPLPPPVKVEVDQFEKLPPCPKWIGKEARAYWQKVVPLISSRMKLTTLDWPMLAQLCQAWEDYQFSVKKIEKEGRFITAKNGAMTQHPAVKMMHQSSARFAKFAEMYGLTPKTRSRLESILENQPAPIEAANAPDDFDEFIARG